MNKKGMILCGLVTILITVLLTISFFTIETYDIPDYIYQVYLDGEKIGLINSKEELYNRINEEQVEIKDEYKVDQVYPPKGFQIVKTHTYNNELATIDDVYNSIKDEKQFTIKGYTITIKNSSSDTEPTYIYVLDQEIFKEAINNVIKIFIGEERYEQYKNNEQPEISDTGYTIENLYFKDNISIKESYINANEKIYTNANELTKYLLFANNVESKEYTVLQGDTIESIAEANQLNVSELLIANEGINSEDTLLAIGQKINVALINPVLSLVYEELVVEDVEIHYEKETKEDRTQYTSYNKVTQKGINGINRVTSRVQFTNGEQNSGGVIVGTPQVIRNVQNEITVKGTKKISSGGSGGTVCTNCGQNIDTGAAWGWPTNSPYMITSGYGYRWGTLHDGMDISGTGFGSPIYASLGGVVVNAQYGGLVGNSAGKNVVIEHSNGYYTVYAHMSSIYVKKGDIVTRRQKVGAMGKTGVATGTHLHFGVFIGKPYNGGRSINPMRLWK